jgi:hypothetical protein
MNAINSVRSKWIPCSTHPEIPGVYYRSISDAGSDFFVWQRWNGEFWEMYHDGLKGALKACHVEQKSNYQDGLWQGLIDE